MNCGPRTQTRFDGMALQFAVSSCSSDVLFTEFPVAVELSKEKHKVTKRNRRTECD